MKLKSVVRPEAKKVLADDELKAISSRPVLWSCICRYPEQEDYVYLTKPIAGCSVTTCMTEKHCPSSWKCEAIENLGSGGDSPEFIARYVAAASAG